MSPKIFDLEKREDLKVELMEAGFELIKQHGMTHASVEKVTRAVGLGKGTFYHFFSSKEHFVLEIMEYQRDKARKYFEQVLAGRDKMTVSEGKEYLKLIIFSPNSIYQYLTEEDEQKLLEEMQKDGSNRPDENDDTMEVLLSHMEGVREDADIKAAINIFRIMAIAMYHREELFEDVFENTLEDLYELAFSKIFITA